MAACNVDFDNAVKYALNLLKSSDLVLKREQKEALRPVCVEKRDCLSVLPTGFGKSLIFQLVPFTLDYLTKVNNSCVLVVSPLNAIISDQIEKLESRGIGVKVFKQRYQGGVTTIDDDVKFIYGHAEVFAENDSVKRLLRSPFKDRIKTIVIDEAHFIIQWQITFVCDVGAERSLKASRLDQGT